MPSLVCARARALMMTVLPPPGGVRGKARYKRNAFGLTSVMNTAGMDLPALTCSHGMPANRGAYNFILPPKSDVHLTYANGGSI